MFSRIPRLLLGDVVDLLIDLATAAFQITQRVAMATIFSRASLTLGLIARWRE